jgi:hypothetical protein
MCVGVTAYTIGCVALRPRMGLSAWPSTYEVSAGHLPSGKAGTRLWKEAAQGRSRLKVQANSNNNHL